VARLNADGSLDGSFGSGGRATIGFDLGGDFQDSAWAMAIAPGGKIVIAGATQVGEGDTTATDIAVARLNADGSIDESFDDDGKATVSFTDLGMRSAVATGVAVQPDGKIVLGGSGESQETGKRSFVAARVGVDGSLDETFDGDGRTTIAFDPGGGSEDVGQALLLASDGKIVLVGSSQAGEPGSPVDMAAVRLEADGSPDDSFGDGGKAVVPFAVGGGSNSYAWDAALQPDGKIVLVGQVDAAGTSRFAVVRLGPDGASDPAFGEAGRASVDLDLGGDGFDEARDVAIEPDGSILVAGTARQGEGDLSDFAVARLRPDGRPDPSFGPGGRRNFGPDLDGLQRDEAFEVVLVPGGRAIVVGHAHREGDFDYDFAAIRLLVGATPGDYDGDAVADPVVFEPATSTFYIARSRDGNVARQFGIGRDSGGSPMLVPGDYDGDGLTDPAVFEPSTATFYIARSALGNVAIQFGIGTLFGGQPAPVSADFDGDGMADPAVFEPSTATFYIARSGDGNVARQFGIGSLFGGDPTPVVGDYDGDFVADPAVFEPSTATFYLARSRDGNVARQFGIGRDFGGSPTPVPGDYDGDHKADPAVFEPSTATFYLARSRLGNVPIQFGIGTLFGGDPVAVPSDFDGDGVTDPGVFEPFTSTFYLARSTRGNVATQFGIGRAYGGAPVVVPADFDGDGIVDPAVFEPTTATFYLARSTGGNVARQFGVGTMFGGDPVPLPQSPLALLARGRRGR
jgi:uncharacterized delta-60 repeat protein